MPFWTMPLPGLMRKNAVMLPVFVASSGAYAGSSPSVVFNKPAGVQPGDLMIAVIAANGTGSPTIAGWTLQYSSTPSPYFYVFSKVAGGSEPANYTFNLGFTPDIVVNCLAYRGGMAVFDQVGVRDTGVTANPATAPSITTSNQGVLIAAFAAQANTTVSVGPSGMTSRSITSGGGYSLTLYELSPSLPGVTGNKTLNWGAGSFARAGLQLQIR